MTPEGDLEVVRSLVGAALASLEASRGRIDDLNVYPVPDGDTGTNLTLTVRAVAEAVSAAEAADRPALAQTVARAALMGARGNSGVIFSQIVRGVADVLASSTNGIDPALTARALRGASDAAYRAVRRPAEGTMLSVIRELAEEAERHAGEAGPLGDLLVELVRHGEETVGRTPEQLDVLREAGVVDAGGAGLVELLRGLTGAVNGDVTSAAPARAATPGEEKRERWLSLVPATGERDTATGEVTRASRDLVLNGLAVRRGDWLGVAEGEPVAGGDDFVEVASSVVEQLLGKPRTVLTLLTGGESPPLDGLVERLTAAHPELEVEVHEGGQPHFPLLLGAE